MTDERSDLTTHHVRAAISEDRSSVDWIVRRFSPLLGAQARMRLAGTPVDASEAEDVVAEAWLVMLPRLGEIVPREGRLTPVVLSFLATTVRALGNRRIENALKRRTRPLDGVDVARAEPSAGARRGDDPAFSRRVREALDGLDERARTIVLLRAVEGVENRVIAEELGEAPNNVSHRYRRALERLREALPESVFDEWSDD